jgi:hypothetical protein
MSSRGGEPFANFLNPLNARAQHRGEVKQPRKPITRPASANFSGQSRERRRTRVPSHTCDLRHENEKTEQISNQGYQTTAQPNSSGALGRAKQLLHDALQERNTVLPEGNRPSSTPAPDRPSSGEIQSRTVVGAAMLIQRLSRHVIELQAALKEKSAQSQSIGLVLERTKLEAKELYNTCIEKDVEIAALKRQLAERDERDRRNLDGPFNQGLGTFK